MNEEQANQEALDLFGQLLMKFVRDNAIVHGDMVIEGQYKGERPYPVSVALSQFDAQQREAIHRLVPEIVDEVLFLLCNHLDASGGRDPEIAVAVKTKYGVVPNLALASEDLNWEIYRWIAFFSKQRTERVVRPEVQE